MYFIINKVKKKKKIQHKYLKNIILNNMINTTFTENVFV